MAIRQTSIDCYNQIKSEGLLSDLKLLTYHAILHTAPCTAGELQSYIEKNEIKVKHSWKLLSQLRDLGVIYERSERACFVTGRNVIEWDITDKLPLKEKAPVVTKKQKIEEVLNEISALGKKLSNEEEKKDLRSIYLKIKALK
jgi:hypothetical protein